MRLQLYLKEDAAQMIASASPLDDDMDMEADESFASADLIADDAQRFMSEHQASDDNDDDGEAFDDDELAGILENRFI